jgi:hypothetical protein
MTDTHQHRKKSDTVMKQNMGLRWNEMAYTPKHRTSLAWIQYYRRQRYKAK